MLFLDSGTLYLKDLNESNSEYIKSYFYEALRSCEFKRLYIEITGLKDLLSVFLEDDTFNQITSFALEIRHSFGKAIRELDITLLKMRNLREIEFVGIKFEYPEPSLWNAVKKVQRLKLNSCSFKRDGLSWESFCNALDEESRLNSVHIEQIYFEDGVKISRLKSSLQRNKNVRSLTLDYCEMSAETVRNIVPLLNRVPPIEVDINDVKDKNAAMRFFDAKLLAFKRNQKLAKLKKGIPSSFWFIFSNIFWQLWEYKSYKPELIVEVLKDIKNDVLESIFYLKFKIHWKEFDL